MNNLYLSVIMPCLNPGKFLDESINSCLVQKDLHELIIADGGIKNNHLQSLEEIGVNIAVQGGAIFG